MATYGSAYEVGTREGHDERAARLDLKWSAIFGGGVIGWGALFFLSLLGLTIGLAAIEPYSWRPGAGLDTGSAIWGIVSLILSSILGAYCVVRIAGERRKREAATDPHEFEIVSVARLRDLRKTLSTSSARRLHLPSKSRQRTSERRQTCPCACDPSTETGASASGCGLGSMSISRFTIASRVIS